MKKCLPLLAVISLCFSVMLKAQNTDSLSMELAKAESSSEKSEIHIEIAKAYAFRIPDSAFIHADKALKLLEGSEEYMLMAAAHKVKGNAYWMKSDLQSARGQYKKSQKYYEIINSDKKLAGIFYNLALTHDNLNYDSMFHYTALTKEFAKKCGDSSMIIKPQIVETGAYTKLGLFEKGLETAFNVLRYAERIQDSKLIVQSLISVANIYSQMSKTEQALLYYNETLKELDRNNDLFMRDVAYSNMALLYQKNGDTTNFKKYGKKGLEIAGKTNNIRSLYGSLINFTKHYIDSNNIPLAKKYADSVLQVIEDNNLSHFEGFYYLAKGNIYRMENKPQLAAGEYMKVLNDPVNYNHYELIMSTYNALTRADTMRNDYKSAYYHKEKERQIRDSVENTEVEKQIQGLHIRYQTEKKEQQLALLEKERQRQELKAKNNQIVAFSAVGITILLIVLIIIVLASRKKLKQRNQEIFDQREEISQQADRLKEHLNEISNLSDFKHKMTQMLVHDLKNPLNVLLNIDNIPTETRDKYHKHSAAKMHNLVMNILEVNRYKEKQFPLRPEPFSLNLLVNEIISNNHFSFEAEEIRFINLLSNEITVLADRYLTERMITNIITNALKYTNKDGYIKLEARIIESKKVIISLTDNGIGVSEDKLEHVFSESVGPDRAYNYSTGIGLAFCKLAADMHGQDIGVESEKGQGTRIWFSLELVSAVKADIPPTVPEVGTAQVEVTEQNMSELKAFRKEIQEIQVEEFSKFQKLYKRLCEADAGNKQWREALYNAVINLNQDKYNQIAAMLNE
jgi:signal transduction histidine kinase